MRDFIRDLTSRMRSVAAGMISPIVTLAAGALLLPGVASAASSEGNDFIVGFLANTVITPTIELHLTSPVSMSVQVEYPVGINLGAPVALTPGNVSIVTIPNTASTGWPVGAPSLNAVRASSVNPAQRFTCYMINRAFSTSDAGLALPLDSLGNFYRIITATPSLGGGKQYGSQFVVVATQNGTTVTITPSQNLQSGQPAGVPFNVILNRGEGWFTAGTTSGPAGDLTASTVQSTLPVSVTNGVGCEQIDTQACDHVFEVAQPVQTWGTGIPAADLPGFATTGVHYRIMADANNTTVLQDGVSIGVLNAGQFLTTPILPGDHVFEGQNAGNPAPIFVVQFMPGGATGICASGDPSIGNVIPAGQYESAYTFSAVGGGQFLCNFATIIARNADVGTLTLDGVAVPASSFTTIGTSGYLSARVPVSSGAHQTASLSGHGLTVEGYNTFDSYLYPGGAALNPINVPHEIFPGEQCCGEKPHFEDPAYANVFTGQVAVATCYADLATDAVLVVEDLKNQATAPLNTNYAPPAYHGPLAPSSWSRDNLGDIFGVTLDDSGNIFVTATTAYSNDIYPTGRSAMDIYRIDGATAAITPFATLPQAPATLPGAGLGNIAYDCTHKNFYVSDIDDGLIYRLDVSGNTLSTWNHGLNLQTANPPSTAIPDDPMAPFTQLGRRVWGLQEHNDRLYYAVWWEDDGQPNPVQANEVWSVALSSSGNFVPGTDQLEISIPPLDNENVSNPVSDISFGPAGTMLLAERSMLGDTSPGAHRSRALEYTQVAGTWTLLNPAKFQISQLYPPGSSAGGVDYDFGAGGHVWVTGDALHLNTNDNIYGLQGLPANGGSIVNSILIDLNGDVSQQNKTQIGDIELPCPDCEINGTVITPSMPGAPYAYQFAVTNHSTVAASNIVILPVSGVTSITPQTIHLLPALLPGQTSPTFTLTLNGAQPGVQVCFNIALVATDGTTCCSRQLCVPIPGCYEVLSQVVKCLPNGQVQLTVTIKNLEAYTLYYAAIIPFDPTKTATPSFFTLGNPVPPFGTTTISTVISPVAFGETVFYTLTIHSANLEICCSRDLSFTANCERGPICASSRLTHRTAGSFDIDMPLTGTSGVENRDGAGSYLAVFTFDDSVTSGEAAIVSGTATAGVPTFEGNEMRVPLSGVADQQTVTVEVSNVNGDDNSDDVPFGFLIGDVNGDRTVNSTDSSLIKGANGQLVTSSNFRDDINLSGRVDNRDSKSVTAHKGHGLP